MKVYLMKVLNFVLHIVHARIPVGIACSIASAAFFLKKYYPTGLTISIFFILLFVLYLFSDEIMKWEGHN